MSLSFEITGTMHSIGETQQIKETFTKREFIIEVADGNYPQHIKCQVTKDRCKTLDAFKAGEAVNVCFNLRGRLYTNKNGQQDAFTNLEAWRIESLGASQAPAEGKDMTNAFDDVPF